MEHFTLWSWPASQALSLVTLCISLQLSVSILSILWLFQASYASEPSFCSRHLPGHGAYSTCPSSLSIVSTAPRLSGLTFCGLHRGSSALLLSVGPPTGSTGRNEGGRRVKVGYLSDSALPSRPGRPLLLSALSYSWAFSLWVLAAIPPLAPSGLRKAEA